jgi:hypothetical protein
VLPTSLSKVDQREQENIDCIVVVAWGVSCVAGETAKSDRAKSERIVSPSFMPVPSANKPATADSSLGLYPPGLGVLVCEYVPSEDNNGNRESFICKCVPRALDSATPLLGDWFSGCGATVEPDALVLKLASARVDVCLS